MRVRALIQVLRFLGIFGLLTSSSIADALTITYSATKLTDVTAGENLWQYDYTLTDAANLAAFQGINVEFDPALYANLGDPPAPVNSDWIASVLAQPNSTLPANGLYQAVALVDHPSTTGTFSITFDYLGHGTPGAQTFEVFNSDFSVSATGTTSPVPLPAAGWLLSSALAASAAVMRRRRRA